MKEVIKTIKILSITIICLLIFSAIAKVNGNVIDLDTTYPDNEFVLILEAIRAAAGGDGGVVIHVSGEDLQNHKNGIFCEERDGTLPYEYYTNDTLKGASTPNTDGTLEANSGTPASTSELFRNMLSGTYTGRTLWREYPDLIFRHELSDQNLATLAFYHPVGTRDMTPTEQYIFAHRDDNLVQEMVWLLKDGGGNVIPSGGTAATVLDEAKTYEYVINNIKTPSLDGDEATVSYSYSNKDFLIGPFTLDYTRYYIYGGANSQVGGIEGGKINFSGIIGATAKLDTELLELSTENFVYPREREDEAKLENGYRYPYPGEEFYVRLSLDEVGDAQYLENLKFKFQQYVEGEGELTHLEGKYGEFQFEARSTQLWCDGPFTREENVWCDGSYICPGPGRYSRTCGHGYTRRHRQPCGHGEISGHWAETQVRVPCEHGYYGTHPLGWEEWLQGVGGTLKDAQKLIMVTSNAKVGKTYKSTTQNLNNLSLRMNYGGTVWEDEHTGKMQDQDGQLGYNENGQRTENGIKNIKVTIYNKENGQPYASTYTDENGNYLFSQIKMGQYYAVFEYDGQTWEPTSYFVGGDANFATNSKAQENEQDRINFNNKFKEMIETGALSNTGVLQNINYDTATQGKSFALTNDDGKVEGDYYSFFRMTATTMDNNYNIISYPRENEVHIEDWDKTIAGTTYVALYPDIEHINLGLVRRSAADFEVRKDVYKAIIEINGKTEEYTYSSRDNITESFDIEVKMGPDYGEPEYNRAIYRSDYNYRISDYADGAELNKQAKNARGGENAVDDMISAITEAKGTNSELKIYIIYKITIANRSSLYAGTINELVDYYDQEYTYTGESWYGSPTTTQNTVTWTNAPKYNTAKQYDGYNTIYTQTTGNMMLNSGEMVDIYVKFEVNKHTDENGKADSIILDETLAGEALGGKNNVVEITNYSTFKEGTTVDGKNVPANVEGKIERDSRPGSAVPGNQATYEDDTDGAPRMNIILHKSVERSIYGYVWEDNRTNTLQTGQIIGNGYREDNETLINGAVVQLIEKVEINGQTYEYIWREMETGDATMKYLDYDGNLQTDTLDNIGENDPNKAQSSGKYFFNKYIPGNYIVRFIYGDNASTLQTSENGGKNAISYNGQDYKSTIYTAQETNNAANERFYNFASVANASKARDNAFRRLNVNKYSEVLNNHIGNVLYAPYASPNDTALMQELRDNTWMYADTAIINATVAYNSTSGDLSANTGYTNSLSESQNTAPVYIVENMGFGLEERPRTNIVLTKQIENATITLTDGTVLLDTANGIRSGLQAQPNKYTAGEERKSVQQGIWTFQIDDELLQGAELKIYYRLSVENNGQIDTVGQSYDLANNPSTLLEAEAMLGNSYYYGTTDGVRVVTTSVDKILDYVDRSIAFNADMETNNGVWYSIENMNDLKAAGLLDENITITDNTTTNKLVMTETLQSSKLDPVENTGDSTVLVLTRILGGNSSEEDYTYVNLAEIIQLTNEVGRKDPHEITGDTDPNIANENEDHDPPSENDTDESEIFTIIPPTGLNQSVIYIIIAVVAAGVFITGIVLIKKFAIKKK